MTAAARVKSETFFSPDDLDALVVKSRWRSLLLVAHCWAVIGLAMAVGMA